AFACGWASRPRGASRSNAPSCSSRSRRPTSREPPSPLPCGPGELLVDDLLDVSRLSRGKVALRREAVELAEVVAWAVEAGRGSGSSGRRPPSAGGTAPVPAGRVGGRGRGKTGPGPRAQRGTGKPGPAARNKDQRMHREYRRVGRPA